MQTAVWLPSRTARDIRLLLGKARGGRGQLRGIFISYRRRDSEGESGRLFDDLVHRFGEDSVFMDVAGIAPGRDFRRAIDESVATCGALLAVIGPLWASDSDERGGRRLDDPSDLVRLEIAQALKRDVPVFPCLVRGAKMPQLAELPEDLGELVFRNAVELSHARWRQDVLILADALRGIVEPSDAPPVPAASEPAAAVDTETLRAIALELARYIGPIADLVVKRAARRCANAAELYDLLALEIEKPADRAAFLRLRGGR
jgi:hypothetical protein